MTPYLPSPRPTFAGPAAIPYSGVTRHIWGDAEAGEVAPADVPALRQRFQQAFGELANKPVKKPKAPTKPATKKVATKKASAKREVRRR